MEDYRDAVIRIVTERYPTPPNVIDLFEVYHNVPPARRHRIPPHDLAGEIFLFFEENRDHTLEAVCNFIDTLIQ